MAQSSLGINSVRRCYSSGCRLDFFQVRPDFAYLGFILDTLVINHHTVYFGYRFRSFKSSLHKSGCQILRCHGLYSSAQCCPSNRWTYMWFGSWRWSCTLYYSSSLLDLCQLFDLYRRNSSARHENELDDFWFRSYWWKCNYTVTFCEKTLKHWLRRGIWKEGKER